MIYVMIRRMDAYGDCALHQTRTYRMYFISERILFGASEVERTPDSTVIRYLDSLRVRAIFDITSAYDIST